jgi:ATP-binding cassette subfamily F protein uup
MAAAAPDHARLAALDAELADLTSQKDDLERAWLEAADRVG